MIRVKVFPPYGIGSKAMDERGWLELADGTTLADAVHALGMPKIAAKIFMVHLNSEKQPMNTKLKNGDMIGFAALITSG